MLRTSKTRTLLSFISLLAVAPASMAQTEPFGLLDFVGQVTSVAPVLPGYFSDITVGDSAWGEIHIDLAAPPRVGPGGELIYTTLDETPRFFLGSRMLRRESVTGPDPLIVTDGLTPGPDTLDYQMPVSYWDGPQMVIGSARFSFLDIDGDAWSSPALEMLPFPLMPNVTAGQSGTLEFLDPNGVLLIRATLSTIELDLSNESRCMPSLNSTGRPGRLTGLGSRVFSDNSFSIFADRLPQGSFGLFITSAMEGHVVNPGGNWGVLCLSGDIGRFFGPGEVQSSGNTGTMQLAVDLTNLPTSSGFTSISAGETRYFQLWHRDSTPQGPSSIFTSSLAVSFQ